MNANRQDKPKVDYPTRWSYRIVGSDEAAIRAHVKACMADREHELVLSRRGRGGRYLSLHLSLHLQEEAERLAIHQQVSDHEAVRFVL